MNMQCTIPTRIDSEPIEYHCCNNFKLFNNVYLESMKLIA